MTALLPGYKEQLGRVAAERAETRSRARRRPVWRRGRGPVALSLACLLVTVAGGAYASQGFWRPAMGDEGRGHPRVSDSPLPPALLERFAVLRRPQSADDRGPGTQDALRWQGGGRTIQTPGVRRLGTGRAHTAIVAIPLAKSSVDAPGESATQQLCLWQQDPHEAGGMACAAVAQVLDEGVTLITIEGSRPLPEDLARMKRWLKDHPGGGEARKVPMQPGTAHLVGLVPDGVAAVRIGQGKAAATVPVRGNLFQASRPEEAIRPIAWLDEAGQRVGYSLQPE